MVKGTSCHRSTFEDSSHFGLKVGLKPISLAVSLSAAECKWRVRQQQVALITVQETTLPKCVSPSAEHASVQTDPTH